MLIEDKLIPVAVKIGDLVDGLSHWEAMIVLEMVKQSLNAIWLSNSAKEGVFRR